MSKHAVLVVAGLTAAALVAAGCSSSKAKTDAASSTSGSTSASTSASPTASGASGTITALAAASLTEAFNTLIAQFERANPGVTVKVSYGASSALANQINGGAPVDVFASASIKNMQQVIDKGGATAGTNFVSNVMEIAVPPGNPANITKVADLAKPSVKVALCQSQVPCGSTALKVFSNAKITVKPVTEEEDVKSTLTKVETNAVDAGVVYVTDVRAAGSKVKGIVIPDDVNASTEYPIAALTKAPNPTAAQAFVDFILSDAGQTVLTADGFAKP